MPAVLNAANEIAVEAFLNKTINFVDLSMIIDKVLNTHNSVKDPSLEDILMADKWARAKTKQLIERMIS
jgi:1-deoxy-D-xylulose-5-phosphate reductoisomerase